MSEIVHIVFESRTMNAPQSIPVRLETKGVLAVQGGWTEIRFHDDSPQQPGELALRFANQAIELESHYERKNNLKFSTLKDSIVAYETSHGTFEFITEVVRYEYANTEYLLHYRLWSGETLIGDVQVQLSYRKE